MLLLELDALPGEGDVLEWQRRLADAIIDAEQRASDVDRAEAKRHRHLLRVIADGLVHTLLAEHTIRSLSRHPGRPASLSAQGADFDFVFEQARSLLSLGFIPLIADLTTLISVGDIVGWNADGIVVLECKNRPVPAREATIGRLARQRRRGEQVETYLTTSQVDEGDSVRQAYTMTLPSPDWDAVADLLRRCDASPAGVAAYRLGPHDTLVAATAEATPDQFMAVMPDDDGEPTGVAIAFYSEVIDNASYRRMAPSSYPVSVNHRWRLLEGDLRLVRLVDFDRFAVDFDHNGAAVAMVPERSDGRLGLRVDVNGRTYTKITHELAEFCVWMPVPLAALREALVRYARGLLDEEEQGASLGDNPRLAEGDKFKYMTLYRPLDAVDEGTPPGPAVTGGIGSGSADAS